MPKTDARIVFLVEFWVYSCRTAWRRPTAKKYKVSFQSALRTVVQYRTVLDLVVQVLDHRKTLGQVLGKIGSETIPP